MGVLFLISAELALDELFVFASCGAEQYLNSISSCGVCLDKILQKCLSFARVLNEKRAQPVGDLPDAQRVQKSFCARRKIAVVGRAECVEHVKYLTIFCCGHDDHPKIIVAQSEETFERLVSLAGKSNS